MIGFSLLAYKRGLFVVSGYPLDLPIDNLRDTESCPPRSDIDVQRRCSCNVGYRTEAGQCSMLYLHRSNSDFLTFSLVPKADRVYELNDTSAVIIADLIDADCIRLFGTGSTVYNFGRYCTCRSDAFPIDSFTYCRKYCLN